jgi:segregation and condensation protein B
MRDITEQQLKRLIEAAIFVSEKPLSQENIKQTLLADYKVTKIRIITAIESLQCDYQNRGIQLIKVASGYRFQAVSELSEDLAALFKERAPRYSRALLETLSLIAYKQPITRGEIEQIRGVAVSSSIMKTLSEKDWIKIVGHKEVPGKPAIYITTNEFLDYFSLSVLSDLPQLRPLTSNEKLTT